MKSDCINQVLDNLLKDIKKLTKYIEVYERWVDLKNADGGISQFVRDNGFEKVAIYGVGHLGRNLCNELEYNSINVVYLIDRDKNVSYGNYPVYTLQDDLPEADVVIITPFMLFDEIAEILEERVTCPLLSLEDIIP